MTLQEEMFLLISDWKESKLPKVEFLKEKGITKDKFGYWLVKYNKQNGKKITKVEKQNIQPVFKEIALPEASQTQAVNKVIELTTPSGMQITVFA